MLRVVDKRTGGYCDGVSRRSFLTVGAMGLGFGSLTMADMLRLEAATGAKSAKSIINVHLGGGPSHQDMWDLKPNAAVEYRGDFNPIKTNVPGLEICEHFPTLATMAEKFAVIRALVGSVNEHSPSTTQTGYGQREFNSIGGPRAKFKAFSPTEAQSMLQLKHIDSDRLTNRANLLKSVDSIRREADASGQFTAADSFTQQAVDVVLSGKMSDALDLNKETDEIRRRYTGGQTSGRYRDNERFLRARRLVEAGVRCVSLSWGGWDTHGNNFKSLKDQLPALDRGLSALITELDERGMLNDVTIAVWGEFGRTPRVNSGGGRDHWPKVAAAFLAGGGIRGGQAVGESDRIAGEAQNRPVHVHEVIATLYNNVGIDTRTTQIIDPAGRPRYLLEHREPIRELV
jgi:hypothetical protein